MEIIEKILNLLKQIFLVHYKNSELMDVRSFNVTLVSHFVKAEPLDKNFFSKKSFSIFKCVSPKKNFFKHDHGVIILFFSGTYAG